MLSPNLPVLNWNFHFMWGGGALVETNFQKSTSNFISPVLNWNFHFVGGGGCSWKPISNFWCWVQICSNPKLTCPVRGGGSLMEANFQKSTSNFLSPVLNWNFHFMGGGVGWWVTSTKVNFKISKSNPELKFPFCGGGEGGREEGSEGGTWNAWNLVLPPSVHLGWTSRFWHKFCNTFWASASQIVPFGN